MIKKHVQLQPSFFEIVAKKMTEREAFDLAEVNSNFNEELPPQKNSRVILVGSDVG